jgi:hypothetical protein
MMFARELAKSAFDLVGAGAFCHPEGLVIIAKLNGHDLWGKFLVSTQMRNRRWGRALMRA